MVGDLESGRGEFLESLDALVQVEDITALLAMEMMMVALVGSLVARGLSGDLHATDLALLLKILQRAVDGGDPKGGNGLDGQPMDIIRKKGAGLFFQDGLDGLLLACCASFDGQDVNMPGNERYFKPSTMVLTLCLIIES